MSHSQCSEAHASAIQAIWATRQPRRRRHHHHRPHPSKEAALINAAGQYWVRKEDIFQRRNYILRPKFTCEKKVTWKGSPLDASSVRVLDFVNYSTDLESLQRMIDAYCPDTQRLVCIRRIRTGSEELRTLFMLSRPGTRGFESGVWNPCPPVLEVFKDEHNPSITFVVMPYYRNMQPRQLGPLSFLGYCELVEEAGSILKSLVFFHRLDVENIY
ncbi:hypothetical protein EIP91_011960 [Steccherinum ochraceum]|uniref:Uncharacterized protein n=1 Tax=Steccherinum ochraceum TaxID=92696 RepID=A0A4R0RXM1_9APHY|nr:hypothetical protein EIP91_011960 [Steccherinum ochraceum]